MRNALLAAGCAGLLACSGGSAPDTVTSPGAAQDAERRGELLSLACQACHSFALGGPHSVGPNLFGFFGRAAGTASGFANYSPALRDSGIVWSPTELERWLADPVGFLPGTTMAFTGYRSAEDRAALIDYLLRATDPGPENTN
jgi:cytochrome c